MIFCLFKWSQISVLFGFTLLDPVSQYESLVQANIYSIQLRKNRTLLSKFKGILCKNVAERWQSFQSLDLWLVLCNICSYLIAWFCNSFNSEKGESHESLWQKSLRNRKQSESVIFSWKLFKISRNYSQNINKQEKW